MSGKAWTSAEVERLRTSYAQPLVSIDEIARDLGRSKASVAVKASRIGICDWHRSKVLEKKKRANMFSTEGELREHQSKVRKDWLAKNAHPRGALGMKHTAEVKEMLSKASKAAWANPDSKLNSAEERQRRSDQTLEMIQRGQMKPRYSRSRGGKRQDLGGIYFRSSWEANYARYLNFLVEKGEISGWQFEPKTFTFDAIKRGTRAYTPDFRIEENDGSHVWHEVKGWMDDKSKVRLARFKKYYPEERLIVVGEAWFKSAKKTIAPLINGWE